MIIETERLIIREVKESDILHLYEYGKNEEVVQYQDWGPTTLEQSAEFYHRAVKSSQAIPRLSYMFVIELRECSSVIGDIGYFISNDRFEEAEVGYNINPKYWKKGYATEATTAIVNHISQRPEKISIFATCDVRNIGSRRVLEKSGFVFEKAESIKPKERIRTEKRLLFRIS